MFRAGQEGTSEFVARSARFRPGHPEGYLLAFANIYQEAALALASMKQGESPLPWLAHLPSVEDGIEGMRMIEAATRSHDHDGAWERL